MARIEFVQAGRNNRIILNLDLSSNPFYDDNGSIMFKTRAVRVGSDKEFDLNMEVHKFFVDTKGRQKTKPTSTTGDTLNKPISANTTSSGVVFDAKKMIDAIVNDPIMKKAFYKQPTIFNYLVSAVKGKNPEGTGIVPAKEIISKYNTNKIAKKLGISFANFIPNKKAIYLLLNTNISLQSDLNKEETVNYRVNNQYLAQVVDIGVDTATLTLFDSDRGVEILIDHNIRGNRFNVTFIKEFYDEISKKTDTKYKKGIIEFISRDGSGYYNKQKTNQTT